MRKDMKKCPNQTLSYGIRRTPIVLGLSAALCMPAAFSYANAGGRMDSESVISRKTKCSAFTKHFVPESHLLTQIKM